MEYLKAIKKMFPDVNENKLVLNLICEYANQSVENSLSLINEISNISKIMLEKKNKQLLKSKEALYWMICHHETKKKDWNIGMLIPVCMEIYPNGCVENHCDAEKVFFTEFLDFLKDKNNFDWNKDKEWAEQFEYWNWLCKVKEKNFK